MKRRQAAIERLTAETRIKLEFVLEGSGIFSGTSGVGFFDHMLEIWARHSGFDLCLECSGDLKVDAHHTVEDIGLCLGQALGKALGDKRGINRYASLAVPMDECLVLCALDLSGRPGFYWNVSFASEKVGDFDTQLVSEFWRAFAGEARITVHVRELAGGNSHHLAEAVFKGMARVLKDAVRVEGGDIPSTKGVLV